MKKINNTGQIIFNEYKSKRLLKEYGIPVVDEFAGANKTESVKHAENIGFPVVLKGLGRSLTHKTEMGLVHLNLANSRAVEHAADSIMKIAGDRLEGFLIQPQVEGKREFMAGMFRDVQFGPVVLFGLGGVFAEAIKDITFRLAPLTMDDAREMMCDLKSGALLEAFRGEKAAESDQLMETLMGLSRIAIERPDIQEIDINPLLVNPQGRVYAVDALIVINEKIDETEFLPPVKPDLIKQFFYPEHIAFIGASSRIGKWGHILPTTTIGGGFDGKVYMVNPKNGEIAGHKAYTSVEKIPESIDMAVITIPAAKVLDLIPQLERKKIKNMLLITSGFVETGLSGKKLQDRLVENAKKTGLVVIGPNTMGICNPHIKFYCTGSNVQPAPGSTAVIAQSGNMGTQLLAFAKKQGIGIRCFAGSGNEAMITIEDYIDFLENDSLTDTIILYVESVKNGRRFYESARRTGKKKPVILLKGGQSKAGNRAAATHTGAMVSDNRIFNALCRQAGIIKVDYPMDLLDLAASFASLPLPNGNRAAIMTLGGGWGVVTADLCSMYGLRVPELSSDLIERLDRLLPPYWSRSNPVDLVGEPDSSLPMTVVEELIKWDGCDAVINLGILGRKIMLKSLSDSVLKADPSYSADFIRAINQKYAEFEKDYIKHVAQLMEKYNKPIFGVSLMADENDQTVYNVEGCSFKSVFFETPERAVKAFAKMCEYKEFLMKSAL